MPTIDLVAHDVAHFRDALLTSARASATDNPARVALIAELERLKSAACALQAELAVDLDLATRAEEGRQGVPAGRQGRGVANEIALARQESPHRGKTLLGLAHDLLRNLPCTHEALREGLLNEHRATIVASESGCLGVEDRAALDEAICGNRKLLTGLGTRALADEVRRRVSTTDPEAVVRRQRRAASERCVTLRPAPDTMTYLTALVPMAQGVAAYAALTREADSLRAAGDERTKGQVMADLAIERLTGQASADAVPVTVDVVISDGALLGGAHEPATVPGHGSIPAQIARELVAKALDAATTSWIRRLYADPAGQVVAMTSKQRFAPEGLAAYIGLRDAGICRTPWCDAPVRHVDHVEPVARGGTTEADLLQGLCEQCNHAKQAPGWQQHVVDDPRGRHTVETVTPAGQRHRSTAPAVPSPAPGRGRARRLDLGRPIPIILELAA